MTHEEMDRYRQRLQVLVERWQPTQDSKPDDVTKGDLQQLAREVGASTRAVCINPQTGLPAGYPASIDDLITNIHEALHTASMIDACRTAAKNYEVALKAQGDAQFSKWVAVGAMLAAWAAVVTNIVGPWHTYDGTWGISLGAATGTRDWIALGSVLVALYSLIVALRSLKYHALVELMRDYSQSDMAQAVSKLWGFWRENCNRDEKMVEKVFGEDLDRQSRGESPRFPSLNDDRRRVSHFYQRMAGLYLLCALPGDVVYRHWREKDLQIIPKVIIPMENALIRNRGEEPGNELEPLQILYEDSDVDSIHRSLRRSRRRLLSIGRSLRASVTRQPHAAQ